MQTSTQASMPSASNGSDIRVAIVEDFPLMRDAVVRALAGEDGIRVVAACADGAAAIEAVPAVAADVVLLDLRLPDMGGLDLLATLQEARPQVRVVILTACEKEDVFLEAIGHGVAGYLTKRTAPREIARAIRTVHEGGSVVAPELASRLLMEISARGGEDPQPTSVLRRQEQEVLKLVASGCTDKEIGSQMYISPRTVQNHLARIRRKTGVQRRSELARWAVEHTWV